MIGARQAIIESASERLKITSRLLCNSCWHRGWPVLGHSARDAVRHRRCEQPGPGDGWPVGPMPDEALARRSARCSLRARRGPSQIWARLRCAGVRTAKRRGLRLMRAPTCWRRTGRWAGRRPTTGRPHGAGRRDVGHRPTATMTGEGQASICVTVDHCSTDASAPRRAPGDPLRGARAAGGKGSGSFKLTKLRGAVDLGFDASPSSFSLRCAWGPMTFLSAFHRHVFPLRQC